MVSETGNGGQSSQSSNRADREKKTDLLWRVNYTNTLREIPFDGKCISYPFEPGRFAEFRTTSMDTTRKFDLLTEPDLGVKIDLVTAVAGGFVAGPNDRLAPEDARLLEDEPTGAGNEKGGIGAKKKRVSWLRRTEYLGHDTLRYGTQTEKNEVKIGKRLLNGNEEDLLLYKDPEAQAQAIQKTFELAQQPIPAVHHSKPGVTPVEVLPVFPDFDMWQYPAAQVLFDSDPAPPSMGSDVQERLSQAMIRGLQDEAGKQFVAYFLPTEQTMKKRKVDLEEGVEFNPNEEYDYELLREYNWNVRQPADRASGGRGDIGYAFVLHGDRCVYNELDTKVRLTKRKSQSANVRSRLVVHFRSFNEQEIATQKARLSLLEENGNVEEEEEAEAEEEVENGENGNNQEAKSSDVESGGGKESDKEEEPSASESEASASSSSDDDNNDDDDDDKNSEASSSSS